MGISWASAALLFLATACEEEAKIVEEIRSIKTFTVREATAGYLRKFSGVVRAVDRSGLSFEVPGNVLAVNVDIGGAVEKGQVLAELDKEPYQLEVQKAEAELVTANAKVKNQKADYAREKSIFDQGAGTKRTAGPGGVRPEGRPRLASILFNPSSISPNAICARLFSTRPSMAGSAFGTWILSSTYDAVRRSSRSTRKANKRCWWTFQKRSCTC